MKFKEVHVDVLMKVHFMGGKIKEKNLITDQDEQRAVEQLIAEKYLAREKNKHGVWLYISGPCPVVNHYDSMKKLIANLNTKL